MGKNTVVEFFPSIYQFSTVLYQLPVLTNAFFLYFIV